MYLIGGGIAAGFVLIAGIILFVTMQKPGTNVAVANPGVAPNIPVANPNAPRVEVADAACEELGRKLEAALMSRQTPALSALFDWNEFANRSLAGMGLSAAEQAGFTRGVTKAVEGPQGLIGSLATRIGSGSAKFVRVTNRPEGKRVLIRMIFEDGASNYIEWVLAIDAGGQLKCVDGYSYLTGELLTTTIRRLMVPAMAGLHPTILQKLSGTERDAAKHLDNMQKMMGAVKSGQFQEVLVIYAKLPDSLKREKAILLQRMMATQQLGDAEYTKALEDFQKYFPDDPALDLIRLDYWVLKKDYQAAIDGLKRLETAMGGIDGHLHSLMAIQFVQLGNIAEARKAAEESLVVDPDCGTPYQAMVMTNLKEQKYDDALKHMKLLFEKAIMEFLEMKTDPDFAGFLKSPQYKEWLAWRSNQK